ncbi:MAG: alpha/beta hydrolase [Betaproteobacteria bacterium]
MYTCQRVARCETVSIRNICYHVRVWDETGGDATAPTPPPLVLVHGWMDVAASYQFMVDAFSEAFMQGRRIIAPDWRGFGLTSSGAADHYWFPDYMADLDFLLDHYAPHRPVDLVGHSMGGNIAMLYAGVRPQRIAHLVNLEGFGMPAVVAQQAPPRYARWMDELKALHRGELALKAYDSLEGVARRLMKTNPRLDSDKAHWLAQHWSAPVVQTDGSTRWQILGDAAHKIVNANLYQVEEVRCAYRRISAPVLAVEADSDSLSFWHRGKYTLEQYHERLQAVPDCEVAVIEHAGHMLHHDQPAQLAAMMERFLARPPRLSD